MLIICLSGCNSYAPVAETASPPSNENSITDDAQRTILEAISCFYDPVQHRMLDIRDTSVVIDDQPTIVLDVSGIAKNGTYPLETFYVSPSTGSMYYFSSSENQFVKIDGTPYFTSADSIDEKFRAETVGMTNNYVSGNFVPDITRVLDLSSGEIRWSTDGTSNTRLYWSSDGRYLAVQGSGRQWTEILILDTTTWSEVFHTRVDDLFDALGTPLSANSNGVSSFHFNAWDEDHTFKVDFEIDLTEGTCAVGTFIYSLDTDSYTDTTVDEISVG